MDKFNLYNKVHKKQWIRNSTFCAMPVDFFEYAYLLLHFLDAQLWGISYC